MQPRLATLALAALAPASLLAQAPLHRPTQPTPSTQQRTVSDENGTLAAPIATNGTFVANFTIKLVTPVPSGYLVSCSLSATVGDENKSTYTFNNQIYESATVKATVSGSTATCSVKLPYSWYLTNSATDTAELTYYLYIVNSSATSSIGEARTSSQYVPGAGAIKIPANNATTTYTIAATL